MRTVLVGAVESTRVALRAMIDVGVAPSAVLTLPMDLRHRHSDFVDLRPEARRHEIPLVETRNCNDVETLDRLRRLEPHLIWVVGWSQLCGREFLRVPSHGVIGYHPAQLPRNRGRGVIPWTILQQIPTTASTIFWISEGVDDGDIVCQEEIHVDVDETAETLIAKHMAVLDRMVRKIAPLAPPEIPALPQDHSMATYCAKRTKEDGLIDWSANARDIWCLVRAVGRPYPGAFTFLNGSQMTIWRAELVGSRPIWAQPGQVVELSDDGVLVQCGDREHILISDYSVSGRETAPTPSVGIRLRSSRRGVLD